ncbi:trehalose-phosphatase [Ktedonosporobacter rubrisoli]|uniref:Trehalose 6-phosphate phosphatase n=1 Tax=Ktedonosporobacter rubrisoli TaxID=2509675 RepID=A0A4P6JIH1_KTERU|nr:trehalose-phosphatase [Ktedonosporobacter rubrisoli]QBD74865.1 trehalose-phosphatase [Ktedonosporobacter rubrisoli]
MTSIDLATILGQQPLGLIFDIDGTLASMTPTPDGAQLWPGVAEDLRRLRQYGHVAILTGRLVEDGARIVNVEGLTYIGTHGLEWCDDLPTQRSVQLLPEAQPYAEPGKQLFDLLEQQLSSLPGVILQRKRVGGTVHYRQAPSLEETRKQLLALLEVPAQRLKMRLSEGRGLIEILTPLTVNKGEALRRYVQRFGLQGVIFAGDDLTDLDAVLELRRLRHEGLATMSIIVRHAGTLPAMLEHGDYVVDDVAGMAELLHSIVDRLEQPRE